MALTNLVAESVVGVGVVVDVEASTTPTTVIGIVVSGTMASCEDYSFSLSNISSSTSISLIWTFYSIIILNMSSLCISSSPISLVCGSFVDVILSFFLRAIISTYFFFTISSIAFTSLGS